MKLTNEDRTEIIENLVTNGCCWNEEDREVLSVMDDQHLVNFAKQLETDRQYDAVVNAVKEGFGEMDVKLNAMPAFIKEKIAAKEEAEDEEEEEEEENKSPAGNKEPTEEEWLASAPKSIREQLTYAQNMMAKDKKAIIEKLTANLEGDSKDATVTMLNKMDLDALRRLEVLAPKVENESKSESSFNYIGQEGFAPLTSNEEKEDVLDIPTMIF